MNYNWWMKALELAGDCGELSRDQIAGLGVSEGDAHLGFYRKRKFKNGPFIHVAIWYDGGIRALADGKPVDADDVWSFCCRNPISEATYRTIEHGGEWPDHPPTIGHNSGEVPSDPFEALKLEFDQEREQAQEFLKAKIETKDRADMAAAWSKKLTVIAKKAADLHKVEKQPSLDEGRRIDDKWRDLKEDPKSLATSLKRAMDDYLREEERKEQERQKKAREEAERIKREAEEAAKAARASENEYEQAKAARLAKEAADAEREAQTRNAQAGRTGAKVSLRTFVSAEITDFDKLLMALKDRPEIRELVQSLANRAAKSGVVLDGMKIKEERRAA